MNTLTERRFLHVQKAPAEAEGGNKVSAVMITYNESANIARTVSQLYWCDEIIIVDSFSTDNTVEIAREHGCKVIQRAFEGFGNQKLFAISQAKNDWILCIDADECLTGDLINEIRICMQNPGDSRAFAMPSNLVFRNHRFRFGKESRRYVIRLFNRCYGNVSNDRVHEKIQVKGKVRNLHHPLMHYSYRDITQFFSKFDIYTDWCAEKYFLKRKKKSKVMIIISIPYYFFKYYLLDGNILNGINGFYWSALMAFYHFVKYLKLDDLYLSTEKCEHATSRNFYRHFIPGIKYAQ